MVGGIIKMPKKNTNSYEQIDDKLTLLTVVKRNGKIEKGTIDTWNLEKVGAEKYYVKNNGYFQTGRDINITEIIMGPAPPGMVWNHKNGIRADNREANLELVPDAVNKLMKKRKKKDQLPNGIFSYKLKSGKLHYRVRDLNNKFKQFKTLWDAFQFRLLVLVKKGADVETAKMFLGQLSRKEYDQYWQIRKILEV